LCRQLLLAVFSFALACRKREILDAQEYRRHENEKRFVIANGSIVCSCTLWCSDAKNSGMMRVVVVVVSAGDPPLPVNKITVNQSSSNRWEVACRAEVILCREHSNHGRKLFFFVAKHVGSANEQ
jgi:hypothetical protein